MSETKEAKSFVKMDFADAAEVVKAARATRKPVDKATKQAAEIDARDAGFTPRSGELKIDRRRLRKSTTTLTAQLAMKVTPETREAFAVAAHDFPTSNDFVQHLLTLHKKHSIKK